jgi:hypothetical protein
MTSILALENVGNEKARVRASCSSAFAESERGGEDKAASLIMEVAVLRQGSFLRRAT